MPGGPTAYGGTKPGPAAGGGGDAGTEVATVPAGAAGADTGAVVGAPGAPIASGLVAAGKVDVWGAGDGTSAASCGASGWIPASPATPATPPVSTIGAISGSAYSSGEALRNSPTCPTSSDTNPPMSADNCVSPWAGFCSINVRSRERVCDISVNRLMYQLNWYGSPESSSTMGNVELSPLPPNSPSAGRAFTICGAASVCGVAAKAVVDTDWDVV